MLDEIVVDDIDVLVIGGGIAGTFAAIKAKEAGLPKVVQVDKGHIGKSGMSAFAAGVMHVYFPDQDINDRTKRATRSMGWLGQQDIIKEHFELSQSVVQEMDSYGVQFVKTPEGQIERVDGRGFYPVIQFRGYKMMDVMAKTSRKKGVKQFNRVMIVDILMKNKRVVGAIGFHTRTGDFYVFKSRVTILATGTTHFKGLTTGHRDCTGDGYYAAYKIGAVLNGGECNELPANFFPAHFDIGPGMNMFVGQGARYINAKGERFMVKYEPRLLERSGLRTLLVSFILEFKQGNGPIYMDMTHFTSEQIRRLRTVLPLAMMQMEELGLIVGEKFVKPIEWVATSPLATIGLTVNNKFESTVPGLFACGVATAHQAYTFGVAPSATSGVIASRRAVELAREIDETTIDPDQVNSLKQEILQTFERKKGTEPFQVLLSLQEVTAPYDVLLLRDEERMKKALKQIEDIRDHQVPLLCAYDPHYLRMAFEVKHLVWIAEVMLRASILRRESRVVLREDYPYQDDVNWLKWTEIKKENGDIKISTRNVPVDDYPLKLNRTRHLHWQWQKAKDLGLIAIVNDKVEWKV